MEIVNIDDNHIVGDGVKLEAVDWDPWVKCSACYLSKCHTSDCTKVKCIGVERDDKRNVIYKPQANIT